MKTGLQVSLRYSRATTPPYVLREDARINALECTVQQIATDLSSSKDQLREVKELLLQLINPQTSNPPSTSPILTPDVARPGSNLAYAHPCSPAPGVINTPLLETNLTSLFNSREPCMRMQDDLQTRTSPSKTPITTAVADVETSCSWASGDTVPVTPNT
ncbi:hypothetical protein KC19_VG124400 [Ceratodon purpureus]|uniref:Uncharacterized protein n=1 Tax=Ceratodon purpureus TaxID=3225 RepID=A0A8T0HPB7_CERPU|nr:hypothetical protein KC19_VG124400 [Ceratodon purpureus]